MNNVFFSSLDKSAFPGREQNLFVSLSKHLYLLKDGSLKYQQKELDIRTAGARELLTRLILLDVDTGTLYGEMHTAATSKDLAGFLARAWSMKADHPMRGLPAQLNVPKVVRSVERYRKDIDHLCSAGNIVIGDLPGGFAAGVHAVKQFEKSVESLFWRSGGELSPDLYMVQVCSGALSAEASNSMSYRWKERWAAVSAPPPAFFERVDALFERPGCWKQGPFELVLNGIPGRGR